MKQVLFASFFILITLVGSEAICLPLYRKGFMHICRDANKKNCLAISNPNACFNLHVPYVSGYSGGKYNCQVYEMVKWSKSSSNFQQLNNFFECKTILVYHFFVKAIDLATLKSICL